MTRLLVLCVLALATGCDADSAEPAPVPYTTAPQPAAPFPQPTAPVPRS